MAKQKEHQLVSALKKKKTKRGAPTVDLLGEEGWMLIKKQKVTILIPPLPRTEMLTPHNGGESQPQPRPSKTIDTESQYPADTSLHKHSVSEREKSLSLAPGLAIPTADVHPQPTLSSPSAFNPSHLMTSENPQASSLRGWKSLGACNESKLKREALIFTDGKQLLSRRMRAINIEKKLQRAGGLTRWLVSLGLERFVKIFQQKNVSKFQLPNLTMKKLKDMGAVAVGPRRKLMHAIDCLCQPYCFEHL